MTGAERREKITAEIAARTGITEEMIEQLVRGFYDKVRADEMLAPVFDAKIRDWEPHLRQMFAFWSSVALMTGRYHGTPMVKHMPLPVDAAHFDRWLALFEATARELCPPAAAAHFVERAQRIAASLELGIANGQGVMLGVGERFRRNEAGAIR
ncbi:group III truncated hemoglobin [Bradyrhizobium lablabi]|uniref:group III truncated hemoglobin n=1 Tax=Bradyrhizobium lablabi TaxID=722472 RepID=UPI001BA4FCC4|nr:group III truncated hemoglobin [Bradyrhizobium lablabi]MBR1124374.1 group III truncated hemoglobin [Bradyrhizobium lablabi]